MQQLDVLRLLTDGKRHSGEVLARNLGLTRAAVWKQVAKLDQWGLQVDARRGSGYRLSHPIDLLDRETILAGLDSRVADRIAWLEVCPELDSTSQFLLQALPPPQGSLSVCLAEYQRAGRGRRGRRWSAPFGGGLCLSAGWCFPEMPRALSALSLAAGVVVRGAIHSVTGAWASLKWPNDLLWEGRKLGGILVEVSAECQGRCYVVIGIGVNVTMGSDWLDAVSDWPGGAVDLYRMTAGRPPSRNLLAGRVLEGLSGLLAEYGTGGFRRHHAEFVKANYLQGRAVFVTGGGSGLSGKVVTVDPDGALVLRTENGTHRIVSGEVSVRPS